MGIYITEKLGFVEGALLDHFRDNNVKACYDYDPIEEKYKCIICFILFNNGLEDESDNGYATVKCIANEIQRQYRLPIMIIIDNYDPEFFSFLKKSNFFGITLSKFLINIKLNNFLAKLINLEEDIDKDPNSGISDLWKSEVSEILSDI